MWNPAVYQRFSDERSRPFHDLVGRVRAESPPVIVDLGCGPGNLTATLRDRWPGAVVRGIDSSPEMISVARGSVPGIEFAACDVRQWRGASEVGLLVSNATLQWVPGHRELVVGWAEELRPGSWLAFQVPGNFDAPSHRALRRVAGSTAWAGRLAEPLRDHLAVADPADYADDLIGAGCDHVDAWETTYLHLLPVTGGDHPVLTWMEGTALRPVRAALADPDWAGFRADLNRELAGDYPERRGLVAFPFRRIFVVARR